MKLNECAECGIKCDNIETDPPEAPEDRICCQCGNLSTDEKGMDCRQREAEELTDYMVDQRKDDMLNEKESS